MTNRLDQDFFALQNLLSLSDRFSIDKQADLIQGIGCQGFKGLCKLSGLLTDRRLKECQELTYIDGMLMQELFSQSNQIRNKLYQYFYSNVLELNSIFDYTTLEKELVLKNFKKANRLTQMYLCNLANLKLSNNEKRNWLYFTDVVSLPSEDLRIINILWKIYSQERFGFSVQRDIWLSNNCNWDRLWVSIGWKKNNVTIRYPHEFTWNISAPLGHLPLFNQLRGVQVLSSLFNHSVWNYMT